MLRVDWCVTHLNSKEDDCLLCRLLPWTRKLCWHLQHEANHWVSALSCLALVTEKFI